MSLNTKYFPTPFHAALRHNIPYTTMIDVPPNLYFRKSFIQHHDIRIRIPHWILHSSPAVLAPAPQPQPAPSPLAPTPSSRTNAGPLSSVSPQLKDAGTRSRTRAGLSLFATRANANSNQLVKEMANAQTARRHRQRIF